MITHIKEAKKDFNWLIKCLGSRNFDIWQYLHEELQLQIFWYFNSHDLITLCFVSKFHRNFVLNKYFKYYDLSTGFCSVRYWKMKIEKNLFNLKQRIHEVIEVFDFEESYFKICKKFRYLSLFSVCLHFLTCQRSCEKIASYCRICSRVKDNNFFYPDKFQDLMVYPKSHHKDDYLFLDNKLIDFDVFLNRPAYFDYPSYPLKHKNCRYFTVLSHAQDLFAYFCSIFVRMYLNYAMEHFSELILTLKLSDEKHVIENILNSAHDLLYDFFDTNYLFFNEFLNVFDEVNLSDCYGVASNKPKFGPYICPQCTLEIITL